MVDFKDGDIVVVWSEVSASLRKVTTIDDCVRLEDGTRWTLTGEPLDAEMQSLGYMLIPAGDKLTAAYRENVKKCELSA